MKKALVLLALVGAAVYAATALSASGPDPTEKRLLKDVASLKAQVKTLQTQSRNLQKQLTSLTGDVNTIGGAAVSAILVGVCSDEIAADAFQGTWQVVDQISAALQAGKTYFGPQSPVTATVQGQDVCASGGIVRSQILPPTIAEYLALLAPFHSNDLRAADAPALLRRSFHLR
jgi:uncharacterized protein YcfJ